MNKLILVVVAQFFGFMGIAQTTDVVLYAEAGEQFFLSVNGYQVNEQPASRVEAYNVEGDMAQISIRLESSEKPILQKPMMLIPGNQMTALFRKNKKGKYVFRPVSNSVRPILYERRPDPVIVQTTYVNQPPPPSEVVIVERQPEGTAGSLDLQISENGGVNFNLNVSKSGGRGAGPVVVSEHVYPPSDVNHHPGNVIAVEARVVGNKILLSDGRSLDWGYVKTKHLTGVEIEMAEPVGALVAISYDGQLTNETDVPFFYREQDWKKSRAYFKLTVRESNGVVWHVKLQHSPNNRILINNLRGDLRPGEQVVIVEEQRGTDCYELNNQEFNRAISSIKNKSFAEEKMIIANQVLNANCLYVDQVRKVMDQFTYEDDKLEFAKKAYHKTIDQHNYYQLNDGFTYSDSVQALNSYIESNY